MVSVSIPYTNGNGGSHPGQTVTSTGVTGLMATLKVGTFASGAGSLTYSTTGTPGSVGTAKFALSIGGQTCTLSLNVLSNRTHLRQFHAFSQFICQSGRSFRSKYQRSLHRRQRGVHQDRTVAPTGVTGFTATLVAGTFASCDGSMTYAISGTPASAGTISFALNIGGQTCTLSKSGAILGTITGLTCSSATVTGKIFPNQAASMVSASVPYTGGNGGGYPAQSVSSTGVTYLTATLAAGNFASGTGNIVFTIQGTATVPVLVSFAHSIGGQSCTLVVTVGRGAYYASGQWLAFDCYNLGAEGAMSDAEPFDPSWELIGNYYQWGRNPTCFGYGTTDNPCSAPVQGAAGPTGSGATEANDGQVFNWDATYASSSAWSTSSPPCPSGYRIPSKSEWEGVVSNNTWTREGAWADGPTNYDQGFQ